MGLCGVVLWHCQAVPPLEEGWLWLGTALLAGAPLFFRALWGKGGRSEKLGEYKGIKVITMCVFQHKIQLK